MLTNKPFGVNFTILPRIFPEDYYDKMVEVVIDEGIETVFTSAYKAKKLVRGYMKQGLTGYITLQQ